MKDLFIDLKESFLNSFDTIGGTMATGISKFMLALFIAIVGWIIAKLIRKIVYRIMKKIKIDELVEKLNIQELTGGKVEVELSKITSGIVYWFLLLIFLITSADIVGLTVIAEELKALVAMIPKLVVAAVIFTIGFYIATFIRDIILSATKSVGLATGKIIAGFVFYFLIIVIALTALNQAGINTEIITNNLTIIFGSILVAGANCLWFCIKRYTKKYSINFFCEKILCSRAGGEDR